MNVNFVFKIVIDKKETFDSKINESFAKKLNMVTPQVLPNIQNQTLQVSLSNKPLQQNLVKQASTTTSSVSSSSSLGAFSSSSSSIEKVTNVGVVNPVINSNNIQSNPSAKFLNNDSSIVGLVASNNKLDNQQNHSAPQQPLTSHNLDNVKKINEKQNYHFQQQINNLNRQHKHQQYDSNMLSQHQQNIIQRENPAQNSNVNHHYQQQHHHQQQQLNSNIPPQIKDSSSSQIIGQPPNTTNSQLLNISPQNINTKTNNNPNQAFNVPLNQQLINHQNSNSSNTNTGLNQPTNSLNQNVVNSTVAAVKNAMPPPPGVNFNPNNQFLMGLPFVCYDVSFYLKLE